MIEKLDTEKKPFNIASIEEASSDSDGNHSDKVKRFLMELQEEINHKPTYKKNGKEKVTHLAMAMH